MRLRHAETQTASILVVVIVMCGIVGATLVAYLGMVSSQERFVHRSAVWNSCVPMCESGIEEALAHINHRDTTSNFAINGWAYSSGAYRKPRNLNGGRCEMMISTNYPPIITVSGKLKAPLNAGEIVRHVRVQTRVNRAFPQAILSKGRVVFGGNGLVNSFNSTNILESGPNGQYNFLTATDRAIVASLTRNATDFSIGNVDIYGSIATGPGASVYVGPQGVVGDKVFCLNPLNGSKIQAGHKRDDFNAYIPDAALPPNFAIGLSLGGPVTNGGTVYRYVAGNGDYTVGNFSLSGEKLLVTGKARIWVPGTTTLSGTDAEIKLATNATVEWYAGGTVNMSGKGVVNTRGFAKDFQVIGLPSCLSISYGGSVQFIGTVYAPSATVILSGSSDAYGALVGKGIELQGDMAMHYDEALNDSRKAIFVASSWEEVKL
jgi:hypothetical protein